MEKKKCNHCELEQDIKSFAFKNKTKGTRKPKCKECDKLERKLYYETNKIWIIADNITRNKETKIRNGQYVWDYLKLHPCIDCSETNPIVLEFDHRDNSDKLGNISSFLNCFSLETIKNEIDKCDVRCANCHRKRTAIQFNWYANIDL